MAEQATLRVVRNWSRHRDLDEASDQSRERMTALGRTFPSLADAPGIDPFDPDELEDWAIAAESTSGVWAAGFLLSLWDNNDDDEELWSLHGALADWGVDDREAFLAWCREPWWP